MKRLMGRILVLSLAAVLLGERGFTTADEPKRTDILVEFTMPKAPRLLTVPVTLRGQSYQFVINTGASWMVYDQSFEDQLGAPIGAGAVTTAAKPLTLKYCNAPDATLGPLSLKTAEKVCCMDLRFLDRLGVGRIHGIIGMSFLKKYAMTLDVSHRKIQFRHEASIDEAKGLPLRFDESGIPLVEVVMPGEQPKLYEFDTGTDSTVAVSLDRTTFDRLIMRQEFYGVGTKRKADPSGERDTRYGVATTAAFFGFRLSDIDVNETASGDFRIGMGAIQRMNLVLDFPRKRMTAERAPFWWW